MGGCLSTGGAQAGGAQASGGTHDVLFFPDPAMPCKYGAACRRGARCAYSHERTSLARLLEVLDGARATLDVCVFTITCNEIADAVAAAAARGVKVRLISDDVQAEESKGSDVKRLAKVPGVVARHDANAGAHMHHKFAVVDGAVLLNGSFNWTRHAVLSNNENLVVSRSCPALTRAFQAEFEKLWALFDSNRFSSPEQPQRAANRP